MLYSAGDEDVALWSYKDILIALSMMTQADKPANIAPGALQRVSRGQPSHGGQPILSHWVEQTWAVRQA